MLRRKKQQAITDAEMMDEAFVELEIKQRRARRRRWRLSWPWWLDKRVAIVLAVILVIIVAEGVRRENQEFFATIAQIRGPISVAKDASSPLATGSVGQKLVDGSAVVTGPQGEATLGFPDGSVVTIGPESEFVVRLVDYSRAGRFRERSFQVNRGQVWATASSNFGPKSRAKVFTPSAVAAVRGTVFYAAYDPTSRTSVVCCMDGSVNCQTYGGVEVQIPPGAISSVPAAAAPTPPALMPPAMQAEFMARPQLTTQVPPVPFWRRFTMGVASAFDLVLQPLGIGKASWGVAGMNYARKTAALEQLRALHQLFESTEGAYPSSVNPVTLEELNIPPDQVSRMMQFFAGGAIERYWSNGADYWLFARARDKDRTLYMLSPIGPERIRE